MYGKHERIWQYGAMSEENTACAVYRGAIPTLKEKTSALVCMVRSSNY